MNSKSILLWITLLCSVFALPVIFLHIQSKEISELKESLRGKNKKIWELIERRNSAEEELDGFITNEKDLLQQIEVLREEDQLVKYIQKRVYLTFDDGPSLITGDVLDILKDENVQATFFILGAYPTKEKERLIKRIYNEGHCIGNHGYSHDYEIIYKSQKAFWKDFNYMEDYIYSLIGVRPVFTRFPGGSRSFNDTRPAQLMDQLRSDMDRYGYVYVDWDVTNEIETDDPQGIIEEIVTGVKRRKQPVVLLHDVYKHRDIVEALPVIIDTLREEGYKFKALNASEGFTRFR